MSEFFLGQASEEEMMYDGFLDGKQDLVPADSELECVVTDAFIGMKEGESIMICQISISITSPGPYLGYKFRYNAKVFDNDASKRDRAFKNLTLLDTQAGSPLAKGKLPMTTENMQEHWVGASFARVKIGVIPVTDEERAAGKTPGNWVQGFGFLREKLPQQNTQQVVTGGATAETAQQTVPSEPDVDF